MRYVSNWLHEHHLDAAALSRYWADPVALLKNMWVGVLLVVLGLLALITAIILAYPVAAHFAAKFFQ